MPFTHSILKLFVLAVLALTSCGCGGDSPKTSNSSGPSVKVGLEDLASSLKDLKASGQRLPARLEETGDMSATNPAAFAYLARGEIVYFWGNGIGEGQAVIAHEKDAVANGGYVLLQDGTVKSMSAAEFAAAPKAAKK